jgi:molybdenum cofactor cytidylyltransferase
MKFGPVPVDEAEGCILAHALQPVSGQPRVAKGTRLTASEITELKRAGHVTLIVARLEADDITEDAAAGLLAKALVPDPAQSGVRLTAARTGRVNVVALGPGIVQIDAAGIRAVNAVNPMVTVATLPEWQRVTKGTLIATIKIISYAVPRADIDRACKQGAGSLGILAPAVATAALIETEIPGKVFSDKGQDALRMRLDRLAVSMAPSVTVAHEVAALTAALQAARGDVLFILTGSATSDVDDVAPSAVRQAGGVVDHFGMPVDPGNLLFLGQLNGRPVIGLPGCARSPALNGADWVLERVICGVPPTPGDIAAMGVGGLLKEIPQRPSPRRGSG